ncbi:MAG: polysaccharide export protein [Desulfobacteraceae bacterium]|nr:polysaccharide export protein [Desulfobacteraceae bacterium]
MSIKRIKRSMLLSLLLATLALPSPCPGQGKAYTVGTGDILSVKIFAGGVTQENLEVTVSSKGTINLPFLGQVKAAGLSIPELTEATTMPLAQDYFVNPQVIIAVREYRSQKVYITGGVEKPGVYTLEGPATLLELIGKAGGLTKERANVAFVMKGSMGEVRSEKDIEHLVSQKQAIQVNLRELLDQGMTEKNIRVEANDVVYIQPATYADIASYEISVLGKVEKPGVYDFQEGLTALDACTMAGGFSKYAAPNRTVITRRDTSDQSITTNLDKVRKGQEKDIILRPGDRIYVPESRF